MIGPNFVKVAGTWTCNGLGCTGSGPTELAAYALWLRNLQARNTPGTRSK